MFTCIDVAKKAGVSRQTVSRVLNHSVNVSEKSREKVFRAIKELSYHPNSIARSLKSAKTKSIGFIIPDAHNPFYIEIAGLLQSKLYQDDYSLIILFSNENTFNEEKCIQYMIEKRVDLLLFTPATKNDKLSALIDNYNILSIQLFRKLYPTLNSVTIDDEYGAYLAAKELISNGHENILLIEGNYSFDSDRFKGLARAFTEAGIPVSEKSYLSLPRTGDEPDEALSSRLTDGGVTGIIAVSKPIELRVLKFLNRKHLALKRDISAVFYDDNDLTDLLKITAIAHDLELIADLIIDKIRSCLARKESSFHEVIKPALIVRNSVAKRNA